VKENRNRFIADWLKVSVVFLDDIGVLIIVLVLLHLMKVRIPLPAAIVFGLLIALLVFIIHSRIIPSFHLRQVTGREGMIGIHGKVVKALEPAGLVLIRGENWKAKTDGDYIGTGREVEVVGIEGLVLRVVNLSGG
jgi:membrane-bound ClpP family serine protease